MTVLDHPEVRRAIALAYARGRWDQWSAVELGKPAGPLHTEQFANAAVAVSVPSSGLQAFYDLICSEPMSLPKPEAA